MAYLVAQSFLARYTTGFLERMDFDAAFVGDRLKVVVDVVQHLAVDLQRLYYPLVRVLQR